MDKPKTLSYNSGYGYDYEIEESSEIWVADFGSSDHEEEIRREMVKIKPPKMRYISWIYTSLALLVILVGGESLLRYWLGSIFLSEMNIFWSAWFLRVLVLLAWLYIADRKLSFDTQRLLVMTISSFVLATIISALVKIVYINQAWTWINILVEPVWMLVLIAIFGGVYLKKFSKK